jgi:hypothetical protein
MMQMQNGHGPHDQHGRHDREGTPINYVENDVCVVISAPEIAADDSLTPPNQYDAVRRWLNDAISTIVRSDQSLDSLVESDPDPNNTASRPADWLVPKDPIYDREQSDARPLRPWTVFPPVPGVDDRSAPSQAAFFYRVGVSEPERIPPHDRGIRIVQQLVDVINARLADFPHPSGFTVRAAHPNWFHDGADDHSTGCPGSCPEVAPNHYWRFTFPRHSDIENALTVSSPTTDVIVAVLDTCPEASVVQAAATRTANPLLLQIVAPSGGVSIGQAPSLTETQATFFHPGETIPSLPPWHLPAPAPAGTTLSNFEVVDHGLMVAGIIRDIAPQAEIHLIRVLGKYGVGYLQGVIDVLWQLPSVLKVGSKKLVVNLSLVSSVPPTWSHGIKLNMALQDACNWLTKQGVLVVASSGNFGHGEVLPTPRPDPAYPARFPDVFSVSTVRRDRTATQLSCKAAETPALGNGIATFGGDVLPPFGIPPEHNPFIDLTASPVEAVVGVCSKGGAAVGVLPLDGIAGYANPTPTTRLNTDGWVYWSGSSFATPIISGIAARLWRVNPTLPGAVPPPGSPASTPTLRKKIQAIGQANHFAYLPPSSERTALDVITDQLLCEVIEAVQS